MSRLEPWTSLYKESSSTHGQTENGSQIDTQNTGTSSLSRLGPWSSLRTSLCWTITVPMITMRLATNWLGWTGRSRSLACSGLLPRGGSRCGGRCWPITMPKIISDNLYQEAMEQFLPVVTVGLATHRLGRTRNGRSCAGCGGFTGGGSSCGCGCWTVTMPI